MKLELIATATFGLEAVVRREIEALGYNILKTEDGKVTYEADETGIVRSNLWLRCADRVLLKVAEFQAPDFETLFQTTCGIAWEEWIPADGRFVVTCTTVKSKLHNEPACQRTVKKAIVNRLQDFYVTEVLPETGAVSLQYAFTQNALRVTGRVDPAAAQRSLYILPLIEAGADVAVKRGTLRGEPDRFFNLNPGFLGFEYRIQPDDDGVFELVISV